MNFNKTLFICRQCANFSFSKDNIKHEDCLSPIETMAVEVNFKKQTSTDRFKNWLLSQDINYWLAFMGAVTINAILVSRFNLSLNETLLEAFSLGFVLIRLLKDK